jgi:hypothetical protein
MLDHPAHASAAATTATQQHPRARSVRASPRLCVLPTVPIITTGISLWPSWASHSPSLCQAVARRRRFPSPPAGRLQHPCARRWPWRSASVSAKTSREGVFLDSPPACCEVCQSALLTQAPASQQSRHPRQRCTLPAHTASSCRSE